MLHIMLSGFIPFIDSDKAATKSNIVNGRHSLKHECFRKISSGAKDLVRRMLCVTEDDRITAAEVLSHPWLRV